MYWIVSSLHYKISAIEHFSLDEAEMNITEGDIITTAMKSIKSQTINQLIGGSFKSWWTEAGAT